MPATKKYKLTTPEGIAPPAPGSLLDRMLQQTADQTGAETIGPKTYKVIASLAGAITEAKRRYPNSRVGEGFTVRYTRSDDGRLLFNYAYDTTSIPADVMETIEANHHVPGKRTRVDLPPEEAMAKRLPTGVLANISAADVAEAARDAFTGRARPVRGQGVPGLLANAGQEIAAIPHGLASLASVGGAVARTGLTATLGLSKEQREKAAQEQRAILGALWGATKDTAKSGWDLVTHPGRIPGAAYEHPVTAATLIAPAVGAIGKASGAGAKAADIGRAAAAAGRAADAGPVAKAAAKVADTVDAYNVRKAADLAAQAGRAEGEAAAAKAARPLAKAAKGATEADRTAASAIRRGTAKAASPKAVKIAEAIAEGDQYLAGGQLADKGSRAKVLTREYHQFLIDHGQDAAREMTVKRAQKLFGLDEGMARAEVAQAERMLVKRGVAEPPVPKVEPDTATVGGAAQAQREADAAAAARARRSEAAKRGAATRKANREAAAKAAEPAAVTTVEAPAGYPAGTRFHGSSSPVDVGFTYDRYQSQNLYGPGFYTTDSPEVALGYTKKGKGKEPSIYTVEWAGEKSPKMLNLDEKPHGDLLDALSNQMSWIDGSGTPEEAAAFRAQLAKQPTGRDAYASFKELMEDAGVTRADAEDRMDSVVETLLGKGWQGFEHTGGAGSGPGKTPHNVQIYFDPMDRNTGVANVRLNPASSGPAAVPPTTGAKGGSAGERGYAILPGKVDEGPIPVPEGLHGYYPGTGAPAQGGAKAARGLGMKAKTPYDREFTGLSFENETMDPDAVAAFVRRYNAEGKKQSYNTGMDYLFETLGKPVEGGAVPEGYATPEAWEAFAERMRQKVGLDPRNQYRAEDLAAIAEDPFAMIPAAEPVLSAPQRMVPQEALERFQLHYAPQPRGALERGLGKWRRGLVGGPGSGYGLSPLLSSTFGNAATYMRQAKTPFGVRGLFRMLDPELRAAVPDTFFQPPGTTRLGYDLGTPQDFGGGFWGRVGDALISGDVAGGERVTRPLRETLFDLNNRGDNFFRRAMALDRGPGTAAEWEAMTPAERIRLLEGVNSMGGYATLGPGERRAADALPFLSVRKQGAKNLLPFFNPLGFAAMGIPAAVGNRAHDRAEARLGIPADYDEHPANARFRFGIPVEDENGVIRYNQTGARYIDANDAIRAIEGGGREFVGWVAGPLTAPLSYVTGEDLRTGRPYTSPDVTYLNGRPVSKGESGRLEYAMPVHPNPLRFLVQQFPALNTQMQQMEAKTGRVAYDTDWPLFPSGRVDWRGNPLEPYEPKVPLSGGVFRQGLGYLMNVANPPGLEYRPDNEKVFGRANNRKALIRLRRQERAVGE